MTKARDLANGATALSAVSATELAYLDGVTSAVQTQIDGKQAVNAAVSTTELGYLDGVTSAIQTQLDAKTAKSTLTTTGDIYYASAANTPARLAIGSTDQVLKVTGGIPAWATPASGGGMTVLASGNMPTGGSSPLDLTSISGSYNDLRLVMRNVTFNANTGQYVRVNNQTTGIYNNFLIVMDGSTFATSGSNTATHNSLWYNGMTPSSTVTMIVDLPDYANTTSNKIINSTSYYQKHDTTGIWQCIRNFGGIRMTSAIDRISMVNETASSVSGGTYVLYGIK